jgi:transcription elongation factor SPT6
LDTIQTLLEARSEKVADLQAKLRAAEAQSRILEDPLQMERVERFVCQSNLMDSEDYRRYLLSLSESRHILDLHGYLNLIKEGNETIRKKELPMLDSDQKDSRKRSRRFDRDFYRTCVAEGLRAVCYRFLLAPHRVGIKLQDTLSHGSFDFSKSLDGTTETGNPLQWAAPVIPTSSPSDFALELVGSGELTVLSSKDDRSAEDPLRGCRYVAAMELAHEPRVRRCLRDVFRKNALLTTKPTKKGMEDIDAFHDFYGLHLIRNKPVKAHFPMDLQEMEARKAELSPSDQAELEREMKSRHRDSCLQYLHILKAEQSGDTSVHVHLPFLEQPDNWYSSERLTSRENQNLSCLLDELRRVYLPLDGDTEEWNLEREKVLQLALTNFLLPQFELELRRDLRDEAGSVGTLAAAESLRAAASQGPYRPSALLHKENRFLVPTGSIPVVGVCVSVDPKDATYLAAVTERGETGDYLAIPTGTRIDSNKMREKVVMYLLQTRPHAILVGTSGGFESRTFVRKMGDILAEALQRWKNRGIQGEDEDDDAFDARQHFFRQLLPPGHYDYDHEEWECNVDLVDDSVAQLFGRSVRSRKEFAEHGVNLRCAIATARYAKDPLAEFTYAWSVASDAGVFGTELLYLNIHPMQQLMPKTLLLRQYERALCDVVADVGVDVNLAVLNDHLKGLLMFVPGLGPRKAAHLKQSMAAQGGGIARRRDLLEHRMLGPIVYNNSVAFLKVREVEHLADQLLHPLDSTRLHPDVYLRNNWAVKIAFDALERDDMRSKEAAALKALRDVMDNSYREVARLFQATKNEWEKHYGPSFNLKDWDPRTSVPTDMWRDKVEELDLNAFANMIEENGHGRWHSHLEMIKWEFRLSFADPRKPIEPLTGDKLFRLITGESDQSLRPGKEVTGRIATNGDFGSKVQLEGQIPAFIPLRNLADDHVESADDFVQPGQVVTAVVTEVKKDHMNVDLSLKMEDFRRKPSSWERPASLPPLDDYFDLNAAARIEEDNTKRREARLEALQISLGMRNEDGETVRKKPTLAVRRACTHPAFRNARHSEVMRELREGGAATIGEALIHPSSKSSDSLALHWKVKEGTIKVIEVQEEDKETEASIGNALKIKVRFEVYRQTLFRSSSHRCATLLHRIAG